MRVLIVGGTGFFGPHLSAACHAAGDEVFVTGRDCSRVQWPVEWAGPASLLPADVTDMASVEAVLKRVRPERLFLLAALAHVGRSEAAAEEALLVNALGTQRVLEAVKRLSPGARVLCAGSCLEYGPVPPDRLPIREEEAMEPRTAYGVSRACGSLIARRFALEEGLHVVRARSFNHAGRRQKLEFAPPAFADQLLRGRARGERVVSLTTGDLSVIRDYSGIRAAADAYRALLEFGRAGEVYNVCSGEPTTMGELLDRIASVVGVEAVPVRDPARNRRLEAPLFGDPTKLEETTGLTLRGSLDSAIRELVQEREEALSANPT